MKEQFPIVLNKYLAKCGLGSRRNTVELIKSGKVKINGSVVTTPFVKVEPKDKVTVGGKLQKLIEKKIYILLNKPKDLISTTQDDKGRKNIINIIPKALTKDVNVFPVGRLDRNTTGLILLTNDGELSQKLSHPKYGVRKIYEVELDKKVKPEIVQQLINGIELEDGLMKVDELAYLLPNNQNVFGIEIHSGKNRIVKRLFEHFGYKVKRLDRVVFANLTKKNLPRGKSRLLTPKEVSCLFSYGK